MTPAETPTECEACDSLPEDNDDCLCADCQRYAMAHHDLLAEKDARIRELEGARKWAFAYLNHIQQTEPDRSVWAMEPTPKWSFILELAKAAGARWSGHDWESDEAALARSEKGGT